MRFATTEGNGQSELWYNMLSMWKLGVFAIVVVTVTGGLQASWYWPFGSDAVEQKQERISDLMEPASLLIDDASDLARDGKTDEAVAKYREALKELDRIEMENPERVEKPEFATLRNKRAYVNAAIDSLLLNQVKDNARAVAVSDTSELEKRLAEERAAKAGVKKPVQTDRPAAESKKKSGEDKKTAKKATVKPEAPKPARPLTKREQAMEAIAKGDFVVAERIISGLLEEKPNGAGALNLKAAMEAKQGKFAEAEATLSQAINSNPRNYHSYYNMANLLLQVHPDDTSASKRYYETGRAFGGPADERLEAVFR